MGTLAQLYFSVYISVLNKFAFGGPLCEAGLLTALSINPKQ